MALNLGIVCFVCLVAGTVTAIWSCALSLNELVKVTRKHHAESRKEAQPHWNRGNK